MRSNLNGLKLLEKNSGKPQNNFSLLNGYTGASLFHLEIYLKYSDPLDLNKSIAFYKMASINESGKGLFLPFLFGGSVGLLWLEGKLLSLLDKDLSESQKKIIETNYNKKKENLKKILPLYLKTEARFELISGAIGIGVSLSLSDEVEHELILDSFIEQKKEFSTIIGYYLNSLEDTSQILNNDAKMSNKINTGISHGMSGILLYCSYLIDHNILKDKAMFIGEFIYKTIDNISNSLGERNIPSYYPDNLPPKQNTWCYGDMGIGIAMMKYSLSSNRLNLFKKGEKRFFLGVNAFNQQQKKDLCLCHGLGSFISLIETYNSFKENKSVDLTHLSNEAASLLEKNISNSAEFITGGFGEILSLISENNSFTNWESLFLLRNPWGDQNEKS